jgi:hypothetical protein
MKQDGAIKAGEIFAQVSGKTVETLSVWAEANQRVVRELVELSVGATKEGARLFAELQQGAVETLVGTVDGTQKLFRLLEGNAQAMTRSAERLQASVEQAGKGMQETFETTVARIKDTCTQN